MLAQIGWTFALYVWLTVERTRAVARGEVKYAAFEFGRGEPANVARISRNLASQFEVLVGDPLGAVVLLVAIGRVGTIDVLAAWVFGRRPGSIHWCRR
jgi:hypothetical protein